MSNSKQLLESYKNRLIEREKARREAADDIKEIYGEMKSNGFTPAAMRRVLKEIFETDDQRAKREAVEDMTEVYKANLGMLGGTPLGESARKRMSKPEDTAEDSEPDETAPKAEPNETVGKEQIEAARQRGREDAKAGKKVTDNPYVSGDPRRAAWDEGWCNETGTDGMELPDALKPKKKPKPDEKPGEDGKGGEG